jgi:hypothetical protein
MSDTFKLYAPIEKIDKEKRTVAGWATTEDIDKQNEVVDFGGSKEAFSNWMGNIREMHEPKAVGKAIEILPNDETKKIWVKAYISKGAEDTWQKVQEGILTGFSIGGQTVQKTTKIIKDMTTNTGKTITCIMKYKLNELSLVDNPANPSCNFMLVKSIDGVSYQTEIVEDMKKVVITEAEDPLKKEVNEHRAKADALIRKVLDTEELDHLSDDDFGVIRKSTKDGTITKERILPMPDKMHAVRALEILKNYGLNKEEEELVHKKAREILGNAYDTYKNLNRGGEDTVSNETLNKLVEMIEGLTTTVGELVKAWEGAYRPVPGSKETPKDADTTPKLGESSPKESGAADGVQTQPEEGAAPVKGVEKATNVATSDLKTQDSPAAPADSNPDGPAPKSAGKDPANSDLQTQPAEGAAPAKTTKVADVEEEIDEEEDKKKKKEEEEEEGCTEEKAEKAVDIKKLGGSENDLSKLHNEVESLRKRFDEVLGAMSNPKPRKFKIEKNFEDEKPAGDELQLQKDIVQVSEWQKSGKSLTPDQERLKEKTLTKMLNAKFGR